MDSFISTPTQEQRTLAGISHLLIFASTVGILVTFIIWLRQRGHAPYVAAQAAQAMLFQAAITIGIMLMSCLMVLPAFWFSVLLAETSDGAAGDSAAFALLGAVGIVVAALTLLTFLVYGYAVFAAVQAFHGRPFRYVVIGPLADRLFPSLSAEPQGVIG